MTLRDHLNDVWYMASIVWPARLAAAAVIEWAAMIGNLAKRFGCRRLAVRAAVYAYDIADHDPRDATWELHRRLMPWAYTDGGSFRPTLTLTVAGW